MLGALGSIGSNNNSINETAFFNLILENLNKDFTTKKPLIRFESGA